MSVPPVILSYDDPLPTVANDQAQVLSLQDLYIRDSPLWAFTLRDGLALFTARAEGIHGHSFSTQTLHLPPASTKRDADITQLSGQMLTTVLCPTLTAPPQATITGELMAHTEPPLCCLVQYDMNQYLSNNARGTWLYLHHGSGVWFRHRVPHVQDRRRLDDHRIAKAPLGHGWLEMLCPFPLEVRLRTFHQAGVGSGAAWGQALGSDLAQQAGIQRGLLRRCHLLKLWHRIPHNFQRMHKAQAVRIAVHGQRRVVHQNAHHVVGQQHAIQFLDHADRRQTAQGATHQALMGVDFINHDLNLPPFVIGAGHIVRRGQARIQQRGDHAVFLPLARQRGISDGRGDDPHQDVGALAATRIIRRQQLGQHRAIRQRAHRHRLHLGGQPTEDADVAGTGRCHHIKAVEAAIPQHQHAALHRAQPAKSPDPFTGLAGPEAGIHDRVGAALNQIDALQTGFTIQ